MAENPVISSIHGFGEQPRGVDPIPDKGLGYSEGFDYGVLMLSSTGGVESSSETLAWQGLWSELLTDRNKSD